MPGKKKQPVAKPKPRAAKVVVVQKQVKQYPRKKAAKSVGKIVKRANLGAESKNILHFLNPSSAYDFRWPYDDGAIPSATKTGAVVLYNVNQYTNSGGFAGTYTGGTDAAKGTQVFYLFRNPLRAAVVLTTVSAAATYHLYFPSGLLTYAPVAGAQSVDLPFAYGAAAGAVTPHGQYLYMGGLNSRPEMSFVWLNTGDLLRVTTAGAGVPNDFFSVYQADSPGSTMCQANPVGSPVHITTLTTTTILTASSPGYYGVAGVTAAAAVTWTWAVDLVVSIGDCFSHIAVPNAQTHPTYLSNVRLLSSSMLLSNVASTLNKEGTIYGAVISDGTPFYTHTTPSDLTAKADHFAGRATQGLYTWLRPGGVGTFSYRKAMTVDPTTGAITDTTFSLDDGSSYQVAVVFTIGTSSTTYPGLDFLTAFAFSLEFKTDDQWVEVDFPTLTAEAATCSLEVALRAKSFSENPLHLADIRAFASRAGRFLRQHSVTIGNALSTMFPAYGTPIRMLGRYLQS